MSKILISGCGITFAGERPTWSKVLDIAGYDITDVSGPAISNQLIINNLLEKVYENNFDHVICQLTTFGKLDVEINENNQWLRDEDTLRNFTYNGYWPSSHSEDSQIKSDYYKYLYSPSLEEQDTIFKLLLLQTKCSESNTKLHIIQGYHIDWKNKLVDKLDIDKGFNIYDMYKDSDFYDRHDHSNQNTVPNKFFQVHLARHIAKNYLMEVKTTLEKFHE
tara:strand:- start:1242 stop:1901 length:660 start_codon:yes stop_codon:yes gene_type:complete